MITEYQVKIIIFGGPEEVSLATTVAAHIRRSQSIILAGKTTVKEAAAVVKRCCLFISNDSGLIHLSAAMNVPTIAIFGPTDPRKNAPYGKGHIVVRKSLPCSPCFRYGKFGCKKVDCLKAVKIEDVLKAVKKKMDFIRV